MTPPNTEITPSRHTPGPWRVENDGDFYVVTPDCDNAKGFDEAAAVDELLAVYVGPEREKREANARLIAAAPDMLSALKAVKKELQLSGNWDARDYGWPENRKAIDAAISKAEKQP